MSDQAGRLTFKGMTLYGPRMLYIFHRPGQEKRPHPALGDLRSRAYAPGSRLPLLGRRVRALRELPCPPVARPRRGWAGPGAVLSEGRGRSGSGHLGPKAGWPGAVGPFPLPGLLFPNATTGRKGLVRYAAAQTDRTGPVRDQQLVQVPSALPPSSTWMCRLRASWSWPWPRCDAH